MALYKVVPRIYICGGGIPTTHALSVAVFVHRHKTWLSYTLSVLGIVLVHLVLAIWLPPGCEAVLKVLSLWFKHAVQSLYGPEKPCWPCVALLPWLGWSRIFLPRKGSQECVWHCESDLSDSGLLRCGRGWTPDVLHSRSVMYGQRVACCGPPPRLLLTVGSVLWPSYFAH